MYCIIGFRLKRAFAFHGRTADADHHAFAIDFSRLSNINIVVG
jgi:hypothetical protein